METVRANPSVVSIPVFSKKCEPYIINAEGHVVGSDGFIVPKNFAEWYDRSYIHPDGKCLTMGVRRFVMKKLHKQQADEAVMDMEQDLLLFLHYLPEKSKHRQTGKTDIIMCFDPEKHHGASAKRFHNYLALCMSNRFCTILHKQKKNPIYNKTNLSITSGGVDFRDDKHNTLASGECTDEFIHKHSSTIAAASRRNDGETNIHRIFLDQFKSYVETHAPEILPVIDAIADANSLKDARVALGVNGRIFEKQRETLDLLQDCFTHGEDFSVYKDAAKNRRNARLRATRDTKKKKVHKDVVFA